MSIDIKSITDNGLVIVSTVNTYDHGLETMVFQRHPTTGKVNYLELDVDRYDSELDATTGHSTIFNRWNAMSQEEIRAVVIRKWGVEELIVLPPSSVPHELDKIDSREVYDLSGVEELYPELFGDDDNAGVI